MLVATARGGDPEQFSQATRKASSAGLRVEIETSVRQVPPGEISEDAWISLISGLPASC
jgi:hypothetical protein